MVNKNQLKAKLFKKLGDNELQAAINELRNIYNPSSEEYNKLVLFTCELNTLNKESKGHHTSGLEKKEVLNGIRKELHSMINSINEDDVMQYDFEHQYLNNLKNSKTGIRKSIGIFLTTLKNLTILALLTLAFVTDGEEMVRDNLSFDDCEFKRGIIRIDIKEKIVNTDLQSVFKKLNSHFSENSKIIDDLLLLQSRFNRNEDNYKKKDVITLSEYNQENNKIILAILKVLDNLNCNDMA